MSFISFIFQDWQLNKTNTKGKIIALLFRIANYSTKGYYAKFYLAPYLVFYKIVTEWLLGYELPFSLTVGSGLKVYHGQSLIVHRNTIIGHSCTLRQSTTIGNSGQSKSCPRIGNHVDIGAHVCIIGDISIGDNVIIGAGSIVVKSIPSNSIVVGNPARVIKTLNEPVYSYSN